MGRQITIEVCLDSLKSARTVKKVAAEFKGRVKWRIELCSNLIYGGGLTPSIGLVRAIRKILPEIEIMVMIRPRIGNFTYSEDETITMEADILSMKEEGVNGYVFGCLTAQREIDFESMTRLCAATGRHPVTFHRAIDLMNDPVDGMVQLTRNPGTSNISRILTSGGDKTAWAGRHMLRTLSDHTGPQLSILPGSGINADNIHDLLRELPNLTEIHLTASEAIATDHGRDHPDSGLDDDLARFGFGPDQLWTLNEDKIRAVFEIIDDVGRTAEDE